MLNGIHVDGMTYLLSILSERYADLGEEVRLKAITELMQFTRQGNEAIDVMISRFEILRQRAAVQGAMALNYEALSFLILRACRPTDQQLLNLLQPIRNRFLQMTQNCVGCTLR